MAEIRLPVIYGNNLDAYYCKDREVILSGPADTGKTIAFLTKLHYLAHKYEDASIVIARKQLTDVYGTVLQTFKKIIDPSVRIFGGEKPQWYDYPNGSRVWVAGLDKPGKVLSAEHDIAYINQAEECSLVDWETLTTRTTGRAGNIPYNQAIGDCNPGSPSHWIRQRAKAGALSLFNSTHKDNPDLYDQKTGEITVKGEKRLAALKALTGVRLQRLFLGKWVMPEGAIFEIFDEVKHKCRAFTPPSQWGRAVGIDPYGAFIAGVWAAYDPQGQVLHIYREYCEPYGLTTEQHVANILRESKGETIWHWYGGGPSERQQRTDFGGFGLPLVAPVITEVWSQIDKIIELLNHDALMIHDSCPGLLSEIGAYRRKMAKDGQVTDKIADKDRFHLLDSLRYLVAGLVGNTGAMISYDPVRVGAW